MALKLGKCRLCLKLGDFYSIFTVDNSVQLSEMVMECARIKVYEGDGLPDKVCSECIQKLSSAYIFKQQCERADQELRRNYVPPPGFSISPPPPNRQSSDSAFSTHTDSSNLKSSFIESKVTPVNRSRKRSIESDNASEASRSQDYNRPSSSKRVEELRRSQKRPRFSINNSQCDSDYEDNGGSSYVPETDMTDSDEPLIKSNEIKCELCPKTFKWKKSLKSHMNNVHTKKDLHLKKDSFDAISVSSTPKKTANESFDDEKLSCSRCDKTFKLKIMLKRHQESCDKSPAKSNVKSPQKELFISLEPIDAVHKITVKKPTCEYCTAKFKTVENLEKHLRVVHAAVLKKEMKEQKAALAENTQPKDPNAFTIPCIFCKKPFDDYYVHSSHFNTCPKNDSRSVFECPICQKVSSRKNGYFIHIKNIHFEPRANKPVEASPTIDSFECRICSKKLVSQESLVTHLAAHASNIDDDNDDNGADEADADADADSRASTANDSASVQSARSTPLPTPGEPLKCHVCDKEFKYRKALVTHAMRHTEDELRVKQEPPDKPSTSLLSEVNNRNSDDFESSQDDEDADDLTCDICEKMFSYKRLLLHHKRTKHNMSSGTKRAKINLKDCSVRCLLCDLEMKVSTINEHNQKHISMNIKPRNIYTCAECGQKFKSCSNLANHIKLVHRLKQHQDQVPRQFIGADLADFCEVVVTKAEPLDEIQSHNGFGEVPSQRAPTVDLNGFTCPICGKKMGTLIALKRHVNWHSNVGNHLEKKLECFVCKETFKFQCHYKLHMREHYNDPNIDSKFLTCSICNRKSKHLRAAQAHMNYHKQTRFQNKDYQCSICKRVFQYRKVYLSHMAVHYKKGESAMNTVVGDIIPNCSKSNFDGTHSCHLCGKVCESEVSLKHHLIWHRSKTLLYGARHECQICQLQFTNKRHLEMHTRTHYEDENGPYKCNICGKGYIDEDYMRRHVKGHNFDHQSHKKRIEKLRKDKVKCPICSRYYPDLIHLIRHLRRTHPESKMIKEDPDAPPPAYYSCKLCAKVFLDEGRLKKHEEAHLRKPNFFKCKFCGKKTISLKYHNVHIKGHLTTKHVDQPLKCPKCDEVFILGYALHHHLRDEHGINETWIADRADEALAGPLKDLQCSVCLKVLASKGNFERHLDYHNSLRCNYCYDYFSSLRFLEGHLAFSCDKKKLIGDSEVHPRRIKCELCYKPFHLQVKLDCHLRTQHAITVDRRATTGHTETVCDYCFRVFENEFALAGHKVYHRTVGFFGCLYCPRKFNTQTAYRKHKNHHFAQHNVDEPTKCEYCDETFVAFREMIYHMRDVHNDDKDWIVMPKDSIEEKCPICDKIFLNLQRHLGYHEQNKCKKCNEYFLSHVDFDNHLCAIESDAEDAAFGAEPSGQPYEECTFCFKPITKKDSKKKHDMLHRTSGAISCRFCYLKFKTIDAFNIHAFSHRSRKYVKKPIKCRECKERFVKYGPFIKHMKTVHKSTKKVHYRAVVKAERCVVCGGDFPNLHNHYRAHLINRCQQCLKYISSSRLFARHECDKQDADPSKVFTSDENLVALINSFVPKDEKDDEKFYGYTDDEDDAEDGEATDFPSRPPTKVVKTYSKSPKLPKPPPIDSQQAEDERNLHMMVVSPIISDVLSLYQKKEQDPDCKGENGEFGEIVNLADDDSLDAIDVQAPVVVIDD